MITPSKLLKSFNDQYMTAVSTFNTLANSRQRRLTSHMKSLITTGPGLIVSFFWIKLFGAFLPVWKKKASAILVRKQHKSFLLSRAIQPYTTIKLPTSFEEPTLIFTTRNNDYSALNAYSLFSFPVIAPITKGITLGQRLHPFLNWLKMEPFLNTMSYPDGPLKKTKPIIDTLLENRYSVIVFLNEHYTDPRFHKHLFISREIKSLMRHPSSLFMHLDGDEFTGLTNLKSPMALRADVADIPTLEKTVFTQELDDNPDIHLQAAAQFFGYEGFEWVS